MGQQRGLGPYYQLLQPCSRTGRHNRPLVSLLLEYLQLQRSRHSGLAAAPWHRSARLSCRRPIGEVAVIVEQQLTTQFPTTDSPFVCYLSWENKLSNI